MNLKAMKKFGDIWTVFLCFNVVQMSSLEPRSFFMVKPNLEEPRVE